MSDKWVIPEWMREIIPISEQVDADYFIELLGMGDVKAEWAKLRLENLRAAGLLLTPGERDHPLCDEIDRLRAENERLREALKSLRRDSHYECEDCWYSCPKSGECCNDNASDRCTCGADAVNTLIDTALGADHD